MQCCWLMTFSPMRVPVLQPILPALLKPLAKHSSALWRSTARYFQIWSCCSKWRSQDLFGGLVEKPDARQSTLQLSQHWPLCAYIPDIFDILRTQPAGAGGEIQLADAINTQPPIMLLKRSHSMGVVLIVAVCKAIWMPSCMLLIAKNIDFYVRDIPAFLCFK